MDYIIRKANKNDCKGIAHVVTVAWNETYKGMVPEDFLELLKQNEEERCQKMIETIDDKDYIRIVLEIDDEIVGFTNIGKSRDEEFDNCGEIFALYIINKYHGYGFGRKLIETAIKELKTFGYDKMLIACLKENPTNEFYKHIGGKYIKDGVFKRLNLPENIYYYDI